MDRGIENAAILSLFGSRSWPGNVLMDTPAQRIGGRFLEASSKPVTFSSLLDVRSAAIADLAWMVETGLAEDIDVEVTNPSGRAYQVVIAIKPPSDDIAVFLLTKNGMLWISQTIDPANMRL